jgi:hypothetical protein
MPDMVTCLSKFLWRQQGKEQVKRQSCCQRYCYDIFIVHVLLSILEAVAAPDVKSACDEEHEHY